MDTEMALARHGALNALPFYRGWTYRRRRLRGCAALAVGGTVYAFGTVVSAISAEFHRAAARSIALRGDVARHGAMVAFCRLAARPHAARVVMCLGAAGFAGGLTLIASATTPWVMAVAALGPLGFGVASGGALAANTVDDALVSQTTRAGYGHTRRFKLHWRLSRHAARGLSRHQFWLARSVAEQLASAPARSSR